MKKIALALSAAVAAQISAAAVPASAAPITRGALSAGQALATVPIDQQQIQINTRAPIPFKPFGLVDLKTGQPLSLDAIITLHDGRQITASAYFAQINQWERQFNALGYSLREPGTVKLQTLKVDQQQLAGQLALLKALPVTSAGTAPTVAARSVVAAGALQGVRAGFGYYPQSMSKSWDYSLGSQDTIGAELSGQISVTGTDQVVSANGSARTTGSILGNTWDLIRVNGSMNAPKSGPLAAKVSMYVVGVGDMSLVDQSVSQPALNASKSVMQPMDAHQDFHFSLGPIPMSARLGVRGSIGVQFALAARPTQVGMSLSPQAQVDVYGQGGVDAGIASGGIGCDLVLLRDSLPFGTQAGIVTDAGGPALQAHCYANDTLEALSGRLYAYAKVDLGIYDKEWDWDIWNFTGIRRSDTLFDDSQTLRLTPRLTAVAVSALG